MTHIWKWLNLLLLQTTIPGIFFWEDKIFTCFSTFPCQAAGHGNSPWASEWFHISYLIYALYSGAWKEVICVISTKNSHLLVLVPIGHRITNRLITEKPWMISITTDQCTYTHTLTENLSSAITTEFTVYRLLEDSYSLSNCALFLNFGQSVLIVIKIVTNARSLS